MTNEKYINQSLRLNLCFLRIMKEHALFLAASLPDKNKDLIEEAKLYNKLFNDHLKRTLEIAGGVINISDDAVTKYTLDAEDITSFLTGFVIDTELTKNELLLKKPINNRFNDSLINSISTINARSIVLTRNLIKFKTKLLDNIMICKLYTSNYPSLIEHIRMEAIMYLDLLSKFEQDETSTDYKEQLSQEVFWNHLMEEHAQFVEGYLDPKEENLKVIAKDFAEKYEELNKKIYQSIKTENMSTINESQKLTTKIKDFKTKGIEGILTCQIKSIIIPLLADHLLRETNFYLFLIEMYK